MRARLFLVLQQALHDPVQTEGTRQGHAMVSSLGLRARLVLLIVVALVPVFGLFAWVAASKQADALKLARSTLQSQALLAAAGQQPQVEVMKQLLSDLTSAPSIRRRPPDACGEYLRDVQASHAHYTDLGLVGLDGTLLCHSEPSLIGTNVSTRPYFRRVLASRQFSVGEYGTGRSSRKAGVAFAAPVHDSAGVLNAVVFAALDVQAFSLPLAQLAVPAGMSVVLTDRQGTILASHPAGPDPVGSRQPDDAVQAFLRAPRVGIEEAPDANAEQRMYAFAPVEGAAQGALFVAVSMPRELVSAEPARALAFELAVLFAAALFGMACAWAMGRRLIVNPANAMLREAEELAGGNLAARVEIGPLYQGELGHLAKTFNRMAESLQLRRDELDTALDRIGKERGLLDLIINSMSEGVLAIDVEGRFLLFNAAAKKVFPAIDEETTLAAWRQDHEAVLLDGKTVCTPQNRPLSRAIRGESVDNWDVFLRRPGVKDRVLRNNVRPLHDETGKLVGGLVVFTDITERKFTEDFVRDQEQVLELIAYGVPLAQALEAIVRLIEGRSPGSLCSILLCEGQQLRHSAAPSLPDSYNQEIDGLEIGEGRGACGTAAFLKKEVVVVDVVGDPLMRDYRDLLNEYDLRACWSTPVLASSGEVLATFAIYHRTPYQPQPGDQDLVETAVRLARIAIERSRAEEALLGSEARFRELAENIEDVFYNRDFASGRFLYISPAYETMWHRRREELYTAPDAYRDTIHSEDRAAEAATKHLQAGGATTDLEYRIVRLDGEVRWIRDRSYPIFNAAGLVERIVGTARDITGRKRADRELARTNRALQMLSRCNEALTRIDDETELLSQVCRLAVDVGGYRMAWVGYARDDAALTIVPMAHAGHEEGYLSAIQLTWDAEQQTGRGPAGQTIRTGEVRVSENIFQGANQFHWHEIATERGYRSAVFLPLRDTNRTFGLLGLYSGALEKLAADEIKLLQDMADNLAFGIGSLRTRLERLRSQEAARQAAAQVREQASLLDRAQDAIMVRNLDRTIRFWNKGAERLYGWTADEVLGKTMDAHMYRGPQVLMDAMNQTLAKEGDWTGELEQVARDGSVISIEARWTVVRDENGHVSGVLGINTDIRERKRAREEILQLNANLEERVQQRTEQLEFANKQLEAFSYSVSHDLRTPLSAIDGFSNLLARDLEASMVSERSKHYLSRIRAGVGQMGELIDALLSLAQVSRISLRWDKVDLSAMAQRILNGYQETEPDRAVLLDIQPGLLAHGDGRLLQQVLDNLLGNAWKFSSQQPQALISFRRETGPDGETMYLVQDNGAGFDMAYAEKLFGAFERLHTASEFAGTGIGLATVHRIITRHGGRVWAVSAPGRGATFYFTLGDTSSGDPL
ncbi:PAS domain S-box protein [Polaromonas sp.]|uniref:PAS domain S-box protein n=1 Tax=Polaromonas sp. TaxID=1869339 RepID=UPI003267A768